MIEPDNHQQAKAPLDLSDIAAIDVVDEPPNAVARTSARLVLEAATRLHMNPTHITASADGGVAICFKSVGHYADIECFNSGEIWAITSNEDLPEAWAVDGSPESVEGALGRIEAFLFVDA